jgi:hypothetical protein
MSVWPAVEVACLLTTDQYHVHLSVCLVEPTCQRYLSTLLNSSLTPCQIAFLQYIYYLRARLTFPCSCLSVAGDQLFWQNVITSMSRIKFLDGRWKTCSEITFFQNIERFLIFLTFKGTVSRDFRLLVFFMNQFPPSPWVYHWVRFEFFRKFAEIFAAQGLPPVSTTPVANAKNHQS